MPRSKQEIEYTPIPGAVYEVLLTKIGIDDGWGRMGDQLAAEDCPTVNFVQLEQRGLVKRVDAGAPVAPTPPPAQPVVQVAQPHRAYPQPGNVTPQGDAQ